VAVGGGSVGLQELNPPPQITQLLFHKQKFLFQRQILFFEVREMRVLFINPFVQVLFLAGIRVHHLEPAGAGAFAGVEFFGPEPDQALHGAVSVEAPLLLRRPLVELRRRERSCRRNQRRDAAAILRADYERRRVERRERRRESVSATAAAERSLLRVVNPTTLCGGAVRS